MSKAKPPKGMYRKSIHDGSSVTQSVLMPSPRDGEGKHTKSHINRYKRHRRFVIMREMRDIRKENNNGDYNLCEA